MTNYNRFGATYTQVMLQFPGTVVGDYPNQATIEDAMDRAARAIASSIQTESFDQMAEPELELIVRKATAGQTTAQLGLFPVVANTIRLWMIPAAARASREDLFRPVPGYAEMSGYSVNLITGAVTGMLTLGIDDQVFATYRVDTENAAFALQSMADLVVYGAAAEMGERLYTSVGDEWKLVESYKERWANALKSLLSGELIPEELRRMRWWSEVERASGHVRTMRLTRG